MSGTVISRARESAVRRAAHAVLVAAVRGRRPRGGDWGEAVLAEFAETTGDAEAVRWAAGGLRAAWQERRGRVRQPPPRIRIARRAAALLVIAVLTGLAIDRWVLTVQVTVAGSMQPTFELLDRYAADRVAFRVTGLHHGDIVDYRPADGHRRTKRVIGLPGDTVACAAGRVLVNGSPLAEPYVRDAEPTDCTAVTVPSGQLYVLGDHRSVSRDSRQDGFVDVDDVEGRVLGRVWPLW